MFVLFYAFFSLYCSGLAYVFRKSRLFYLWILASIINAFQFIYYAIHYSR